MRGRRTRVLPHRGGFSADPSRPRSPTFETALNLLQRRGRIQALSTGSPELDAVGQTRQQALEECREREPKMGRLARRLMENLLSLSQIDR